MKVEQERVLNQGQVIERIFERGDFVIESTATQPGLRVVCTQEDLYAIVITRIDENGEHPLSGSTAQDPQYAFKGLAEKYRLIISNHLQAQREEVL